MTFRHSELLLDFNLSSTNSCLAMGNGLLLCNYSFLTQLYSLSLRRFSPHSCEWLETRYSPRHSCEQFEKLDLRSVSILRILIQIILRLPELSTRFLLYLLKNYLISCPCGLTTRQQLTENKSFTRKIHLNSRIYAPHIALANLYYSVLTYFDYPREWSVQLKLFTENALSYFVPTYWGYPCEQSVQSKLFTKIVLSYSAPIYLDYPFEWSVQSKLFTENPLSYFAPIYFDYPCEQPVQLKLFTKSPLSYFVSTYWDYPREWSVQSKLFTKSVFSYSVPTYFDYSCEQSVQLKLFTKTSCATVIHFFLRRSVSVVDLCLLRDAETTMSEKNRLTSWDRTVFDIAIVNLSCTGIPHNTC